MALKQINLAFDAIQDRILMRVSTNQALEYRIWLTRRIVGALLPAIEQVVTVEADRHSAAQSPEAVAAVSAFRHQAAVDKARFTPGYEAAEPAPELGPEPMLVARVQIRALADEQLLLVLAPAQGDAIQLRLGPVLLHGTVKLLRDTVAAAGWNLPTSAPAVPPAAATGTNLN